MGKDASRRLPRGGVWDKLGNRFEARWTVKALTELLDGRAHSICLEPPSDEGFEFTLRRAERIEYHQCRRQLASTSDWSLNDLVPVLVPFGAKLQADPQAVCVFASTLSAASLANLHLRAKLAPTAADFDAQLADMWKPDLRHLASLWHSADMAETWNMLQRVRVNTITESLLVELNEARLRIQVGRQQAASVASTLFEYVYEHTTEEVTGDSLWAELSKVGIRPLELADGMRSRVEVLRRDFRERLEELAIPGVAVYRSESSLIVDALESGHKAVLLVGDAGAGKSHVLAEVAAECDRRSWSWLPINLDGLPSATSSLQLGQHLGLTESPADVTAQLASERRVLFVDQLDAISATSGRQLNSYDGIRELLADANAHDGIQLVVACRKFDLESDDRLRALLRRAHALEVPLEPLDGNEVRRIVAELGFDATKLGDPQLSLLASPLHLYLLSQLRGEVEADEFDFSTQDDLYRLFWQRKQQDANRRLGQPANWTDVIDLLIDHLNRNRRLWAPREVLDHEAATAQAMTSEHVLVISDGRISFFHETFFDYAFARRFSTAQPEGLVGFLLAHDQELFRRAQVRAVLVHLRRTDLIRYLDNITAILTDGRVRFHIKHVVASLLAMLNYPTDAEWARLEPLLKGPRTSISDRLVRMVRDAPAWQEYLLERGWIEGQLGGDGDAQARGVNVAMSLQRRRPDLVAPIVLQHAGDGGSWRIVLRAIVGYGGQLGADRSYFEAVLRLIDNGVLDEPYYGPFRTDLWSLGDGLSEAKPDWACEFLAHVLHRGIVTSPEGARSPFSTTDSMGGRAGELIISGAAERAPLAFAQQLVPLTLDLAARFPAELRPGQQLRRDTVWRFRATGTPYGTSAALLRGMEVALRAIVNLPEFDSLRDQLALSGYEAPNYLLARAYAAAGPERAADAARFLVDLPERLELALNGYPGAAAAEVVRAASPKAPIKVHRDLVALILGYEAGTNDEDAATRRDYIQFRLLAAVSAQRLGPAARKRLADLRKHFNMQAPPNPVDEADLDGWSATLAVPRDQLDNLTDADWISLSVTNRAPEHWSREGRLWGGADDLANAFEQEFDRNPTRFAALLLHLPDDAKPTYFQAGLRAAVKKVEELDDETVWAIAHRCHRLDGRPTGRWLTWMIKAIASRVLPDDVVDMVEWYAIEDADPIDDRSADSVVSGPEGPRLLESGINTTRGSAAEAITALLHFHNDLRERLLPAARHLASDPVAAVRTCAAAVLNVLVRSDPDAAFELLSGLVMPDLRVAGTLYCRRLLISMARIDYSRIAALLETLASCGNDEAEYTAGMASALHSVLAADGGVAVSAHPSAAVRHGAAAVYAANLSVPSHSAQCSAELIQLFSDSDERVREAAAGCFHQLPTTQLTSNRELCIAFARSPAYRRHSHFLLRRIADTPGVPVDVVVEAANQFIRQAGSAAGDIREAAAADASDVSVLLIRAYSQNPSPAVRAQALDAIDQMLEAGAFGVEESIESYRR